MADVNYDIILLDFLRALKAYAKASGLHNFDIYRNYSNLKNKESEFHFDECNYNERRSFIDFCLFSIGIKNYSMHDNLSLLNLPALVVLDCGAFGVCVAKSQNDVYEIYDAYGKKLRSNNVRLFVHIDFDWKFRVIDNSAILQTIRDTIKTNHKVYRDSIVATLLINFTAILISIYTMQVYDKVIPTQSYSTLIVITVGVVLANVFDFVLKIVRSNMTNEVVKELDTNLSIEVFSRLLNVRLDQLPDGVGSLSAQLSSYQSIRIFLTTTTIYALIDIPFAIIFLVMLGVITNVYYPLMLIIFIFAMLAISSVVLIKTEQYAKSAYNSTAKKGGLLVEVIDGAETIKSAGNTWSILSRWIGLSKESIHDEIQIRDINERMTLISSFVQQSLNVILICSGAYFVAEGNMTMGALTAATILSSRVLMPIQQLPGIISQYSTVRVALDALDKFYDLEIDNHGMINPLVPTKINGYYILDNVEYSYNDIKISLIVETLKIKPGEKIGIVGPIGSGKSTLLKLLTGMYKPTTGRILLDDVDMQHYSSDVTSKYVGYLQQEHRLFNGTLRDNLLLGIPDPADDDIIKACTTTGLLKVITEHPDGLDMMIAEGGRGLSGGQKQLVAFTRILLSDPQVLLLDEPTASMDSVMESRIVEILASDSLKDKTQIVVTHKMNILVNFDRLIFMSNNKIFLDGQRDWVFSKLQEFSGLRT